MIFFPCSGEWAITYNRGTRYLHLLSWFRVQPGGEEHGDAVATNAGQDFGINLAEGRRELLRLMP